MEETFEEKLDKLWKEYASIESNSIEKEDKIKFYNLTCLRWTYENNVMLKKLTASLKK